MKASGGGNVMYKPIVYNQNVVAYMNGDKESQSSNFLPDISGSAQSHKSNKIGLVEPSPYKTPIRGS